MITSIPALVMLGMTAGTSATLRSPGYVSFGTPTITLSSFPCREPWQAQACILCQPGSDSFQAPPGSSVTSSTTAAGKHNTVPAREDEPEVPHPSPADGSPTITRLPTPATKVRLCLRLCKLPSPPH